MAIIRISWSECSKCRTQIDCAGTCREAALTTCSGCGGALRLDPTFVAISWGDALTRWLAARVLPLAALLSLPAISLIWFLGGPTIAGQMALGVVIIALVLGFGVVLAAEMALAAKVSAKVNSQQEIGDFFSEVKRTYRKQIGDKRLRLVWGLTGGIISSLVCVEAHYSMAPEWQPQLARIPVFAAVGALAGVCIASFIIGFRAASKGPRT